MSSTLDASYPHNHPQMNARLQHIIDDHQALLDRAIAAHSADHPTVGESPKHAQTVVVDPSPHFSPLFVSARVTPHSAQRYETCGDWLFEPDLAEREGAEILRVCVSELGDWRMEACVMVHEIVEAILCRHAGVTQEAVDEFDKAYEAKRKAGDVSEPGDDADAPYYAQHQVASAVERLLAKELGLSWREYESRINALGEGAA